MQCIIKHVVQYEGNSICLTLNRICEFVFTSIIVKIDCPPKTITSAPYDDILYYTLLLLKYPSNN